MVGSIMIIGCDIDNVCVDAIAYWWQWCNTVTNSNKPFPDSNKVDYNISNYFKEELQEYGRDGLDFWRSNLYDWMQATSGAFETLNELASKGHRVRFISAIKGTHHKNKYQFVQRYMEHPFDFVATKEKYAVMADVMIEDRLDNLLHPEATWGKKLWLKNKFDQGSFPYGDVYICEDWQDIKQYLEHFGREE